MAKLATDIDEQIALLRNRGMTISDEEKAKEHLLDIGYYRLGFYWHYFEKDKINHVFHEGVDFKDAIDLYYLDVDLRNLLSKYIYRIEVHFRTQVVYYMSNKYKNNPRWFCDSSIVSGFDPKIYYNLKENNPHIIKHHNKYPIENYPDETHAPAWKTLEFLTFGQVLYVFDNIKDTEIKDKIAHIYGIKSRIRRSRTGEGLVFNEEIKSYTCLYDYLTAILNVRNICSHSGVLFDYKQRKGIRKIPDHRFRPKSDNQTDLQISTCLILFMLSKISINRTLELKEELDNIINDSINKNIKLKNIIKDCIGFNIPE